MSLGKSILLCLAIATLLSVCPSPGGAQDKQPKKEKEEAVKPPPAEPKPFSAVEPAAPAVPYGVRTIPSLHYNYYYPGPTGGQAEAQIPARLYLCPTPVPPYVGYTYITYPPFQPHEWLWEHSRAYYRSHPGGGMTMTSMWWVYEER